MAGYDFPYTKKEADAAGWDAKARKAINATAEFPRRLRAAREKKGYTQDDVVRIAKEAGFTIGKSSLSLYENGTNIPDAITLKRLANIYTVSCDFLLLETTDPVVNTDSKTVVKTTGLSGEAVESLKQMRSAWFAGSFNRKVKVEGDKLVKGDTTTYPTYLDILNALLTDDSSSPLNVGYNNGFLHIIKGIWSALYLKMKHQASGADVSPEEHRAFLDRGLVVLPTDSAAAHELDTAAKDFRIIIQKVYERLLPEGGPNNATEEK